MYGILLRLCVLSALVTLTVFASGCALANPSGFKLGGELGLYAVDERSENVKTVTKNIPWKCRFMNCEQQEGEVHGS